MIAWLVGAAFAGSSLGVGASVGYDLPGPASDGGAFGIAPGLWVPLTVASGERVRWRLGLRGEMGVGSDRVSWNEVVDGAASRVTDTGHFALLATSALTVGPELALPSLGAVTPVLGVAAGPALAATFHALDADADFLLDPAQHALSDPGNLDPYTLQAALSTELHLGLRGGGAVGWWVDAGLGATWLGAAPLRTALPGVDAQRDALRWDPVRLAGGVSFALGPRRPEALGAL
jgi:hypothetical protein